MILSRRYARQHRWGARIRDRGGWRQLGYYASERRAALAVDMAHYARGNWSHKPMVGWGRA